MKRLLCILSGMNAGGAETFLMKVYRNIDRTAYQMDFCINCEGKCYYEDEILSLGGRIYRIPSKSESLWGFRKQLADLIHSEGYERVLRITSNTMGFMDLEVAKHAGAAVCCARSSNASDGDSMKAKLLHYFGRFMYSRFVDVKVAPSDLAARYTFGNRSYERGEVNILHNGVDLNVFKYHPESRIKIREKFAVASNIKLIGHVGRFEKQKNHMFLLEVFQKIHQTDKNTRLLLVGKGSLEKKIRARATELGILDVIVFAGVRSDVPQLLSAMDVFVFPSFYEGMPNTVIEAQATGLPCVISDAITKEANITGIVKYLPLESADHWANTALSSIQAERADTKKAFVSNRYDIESVADAFVNIMYEDHTK